MKLDSIEVIILAGGKGERIRPVLKETPKSLAPINDHYFLEILIKKLQKEGLINICLCLGYKSGEIISAVEKSFKELEFRFHLETTPLGTGGAISSAIKSSSKESFLIMNGDTFIDINLKDFILNSPPTTTLHIASVMQEVCDRYGTIDFNSAYEVQQFNEKSKGLKNRYINSCIYYCRKNILDYFNNPIESFEKETIPNILENSLVTTSCHDAKFIDIGIPSDLDRAKTLLKDFT